MTLPFAGIVTRRLAAITIALVLLAFAGVTSAAADDHDGDDEDATATDTMVEVEVLDTEVEADDTDESDDTDADASVTSTQATSGEVCEPMLVTHRADGSSGDEQAVSITAQAQEFGVAGWVNVAWQAAEGAQLTALTVTAMDGTVTTQTSGLLSGSAVDVLELRFCGSYDGEVSVDAGPPPTEEADDTAVAGEVTDAGDANGTDGEASNDGGGADTGTSRGASSGSTGSGTATSGNDTDSAGGSDDSTEAADNGDDADDDATDEDGEPLGVVTVPTPDNGGDELDADSDTDATATGADSDEPETEVLGVQLTQDSSPDDGGSLATAIGLLLLALVAGGGAFLGFRRLRA